MDSFDQFLAGVAESEVRTGSAKYLPADYVEGIEEAIKDSIRSVQESGAPTTIREQYDHFEVQRAVFNGLPSQVSPWLLFLDCWRNLERNRAIQFNRTTELWEVVDG